MFSQLSVSKVLFFFSTSPCRPIPGRQSPPLSLYLPLSLIPVVTSCIHELRGLPHENNHGKINTLEEIEILKAASSKYPLNDVIAGQIDPIYKLLPSSVI